MELVFLDPFRLRKISLPPGYKPFQEAFTLEIKIKGDETSDLLFVHHILILSHARTQKAYSEQIVRQISYSSSGRHQTDIF